MGERVDGGVYVWVGVGERVGTSFFAIVTLLLKLSHVQSHNVQGLSVPLHELTGGGNRLWSTIAYCFGPNLISNACKRECHNARGLRLIGVARSHERARGRGATSAEPCRPAPTHIPQFRLLLPVGHGPGLHRMQ